MQSIALRTRRTAKFESDAWPDYRGDALHASSSLSVHSVESKGCTGTPAFTGKRKISAPVVKREREGERARRPCRHRRLRRGGSEGPRRASPFSVERRSRRQTPRVHGPRERRQIESQIESSLCGASQNKFAAKITFIDSIRASERDPIGEPNLRLAPRFPFPPTRFCLLLWFPRFGRALCLP